MEDQRIQAAYSNFFLANESFRVFNTDAFSKHPGPRNDTFQKIGGGNIGLRFPIVIVLSGMKLGGISFNRLHPLCKYIADINQYIRFVVPILDVMKNISGSPPLLIITLPVFCF